ncbi:unnamed protein product [Trichobilharzia regenti]|nr:unnamed protein product [Trichobilharzia regenti]
MLTSNQDVIKSELSQCPSWILSKSLNRDSPILVGVSNLPHMRSQSTTGFGNEYISPLNKMDAPSKYFKSMYFRSRRRFQQLNLKEDCQVY